MGRSKIAVLGYTEHRALAPFADADWEIWGLNDLYYELPDWIAPDRLRWFQMHAWAEIAHHKHVPATAHPLNFSGGPPHPRDPNHVAWLAQTASQIPVYMMRPRAEVPGARLYPLDQAMRYFSLDGEKANGYFTNTISYMIALAIMELVPDGAGTPAVEGAEIGIFGVDMMMGGGPGSEYGWQRPSCEFFIGWARSAGIKVTLPDQSDLCKSAFPYGDETGEVYRRKLQNDLHFLLERRAGVQQQLSQLNAANQELTGGISGLEHQLTSWMPGDPGSEQARAPRPNSHKGLRPIAPQIEGLLPPPASPPSAPPEPVTQTVEIEREALVAAIRDVLPSVLQASDGRS